MRRWTPPPRASSDALTDALGDKVTFIEQNASNDIPTCATICSGLVADDVDLILANAHSRPAGGRRRHATPFPFWARPSPNTAWRWTLKTSTAPWAATFPVPPTWRPWISRPPCCWSVPPEAKTVGILYCSAEANSVYQAQVVQSCLEEAGVDACKIYTFADSNDVSTVTATACDECDALYIPTDNTAASCTEAINNVAEPAGVPIVAGEEGICKGCGMATLTISYYDLGYTTGQMAVKILTGESDISEMPIEYFPNPVKKYNPTPVRISGHRPFPEDYGGH